MSTFLLYLVAIVLWSVPFVFLPLFRALAKNKARHYECISRFYELAPKLASDERLTDRQARFLVIIGERLNDPRFVILFIRGLLDQQKQPRKEAMGQTEFSKEVDSLPDDLRTAFQETLAAGLLGMSYSSLFFGRVLRYIWFAPVGMPQRTIDAPIFAFRGLAHCAS